MCGGVLDFAEEDVGGDVDRETADGLKERRDLMSTLKKYMMGRRAYLQTGRDHAHLDR